jgi:uncharacterized membrane protein YeiH
MPAVPPIEVPVWVDIASIAIGASYGTARAFARGFDVVGVFTLALVCGMGGGVVRDLLLNVRPVALGTNWFVATALLTAVCVIVLRPSFRHARIMLDVTDAVMLAVFAVAGTSKAMLHGVAPVPAVVVGVASGVAGGLMADVLSGQPPELFRDGPLYALAAAAGTSLFVGGALADVPDTVGVPAALAVIIVLRLLALAYQLRVPMPPGLTPAVRARVQARRVRG